MNDYYETPTTAKAAYLKAAGFTVVAGDKSNPFHIFWHISGMSREGLTLKQALQLMHTGNPIYKGMTIDEFKAKYLDPAYQELHDIIDEIKTKFDKVAK